MAGADTERNSLSSAVVLDDLRQLLVNLWWKQSLGSQDFPKLSDRRESFRNGPFALGPSVPEAFPTLDDPTFIRNIVRQANSPVFDLSWESALRLTLLIQDSHDRDES
jgi:hypothetical protein